jgi:ADP-L-glycero-D-manno-heptose 6-epimerase
LKIIITGAGGFVGSRLCKHFESLGNEVIACDNFRFGSMKTLKGFKGKVLSEDFASIGKDDIMGAGAVLHEASISDPTFKDDDEIIENNFSKSTRLMDLCASCKVPFIYASSSAVYGNSPAPNIEFRNEAPHNAYARSKLMLDKYAMSLMEKGNKIIGLRYFNIYGPGEEYKGNPASIVFHFMNSFLSGSPPVIYGDGKQSRDFIYIEDIIRANELAINSKGSFIVNVGSGRSVSFNELFATMAKALGVKNAKPSYVPNPFPNNYQYNTQASLDRGRRMLGFTPSWTLENGIRGLADYLKQHLKA